MKPVEEVEQPELRDATLSQLIASGGLFKGHHLTLTDHALECGVLVLSQRWIDGLPEQMQASVGKLSRELGEEAMKAQRAAREAILARAKALRMQVTTLDAKQRRAFVEATRDARVKLNGEPGSLARKLTLAAQAR
jgi:TRAP-type C4-dicarboxylate transport system substrate-binding protein